MDAALMSKLLQLPNELLLEVAVRLATTELRIFSQVNHQLHAFVIDFLARYRHDAAILRLPANTLHNIIYQQLDDDQDTRRCFAQTSQKLYSAVMSLVIRYDIEHNQNSMLNHAATNNHEHIVRKVIRLGGDVNTGCEEPEVNQRIIASAGGETICYTPLMRAAVNGHVEMLHLLLAVDVDGIQWGLIAAMLARQKRSILVLSYRITLEDMYEILRWTCWTKMLSSYRYFVAHGPENKRVRHMRSAALLSIMLNCASKDDFVKRKLDENNFQCAAILLEYGADPDYCYNTELSEQHLTTRHYAAKNPDPRRNTQMSMMYK